MSHLGSLERMTQHQEVKGVRDERMDGDDGGDGMWEGGKKKGKKQNKEKYKTGEEDILSGRCRL